MANDKDFILKNAVEVGGPTNVTLGTVTSDNIDLSTGNYFKDTPTGNSTYSISNAGDVQSFQLEVTGGLAEVAENFSTTLYTGNGSAQTITNGIDLAGDGGLVWTKVRDQTGDHALMDSESSWLTELASNKNDAAGTTSYVNFVDNSNGYSMNTAAFRWNESSRTYASWTFKKATKFFDVVTYTGDGTLRNIPHNLGSVPGMIIVKRTDGSNNWYVQHTSTGPTKSLFLDTTSAATTRPEWGNTSPTASVFTVDGTSVTATNYSGFEYVAYLFAHETAADSQIKCGSYTGTGANQSINLGFDPQWLLIKSTGASDWYIIDTKRGFTSTSLTNKLLSPNSSTAEFTVGNVVYDIAKSSTGFDLASTASQFNASGGNYIYMAIRAASDPDITWPSSIEWAGGVAPSAPAVGETDVFTFNTDDGGTSYVGVKTADNLS